MCHSANLLYLRHFSFCQLTNIRLSALIRFQMNVGTICGFERISASHISSCVGFRLLSSRFTCFSLTMASSSHKCMQCVPCLRFVKHLDTLGDTDVCHIMRVLIEYVDGRVKPTNSEELQLASDTMAAALEDQGSFVDTIVEEKAPRAGAKVKDKAPRNASFPYFTKVSLRF